MVWPTHMSLPMGFSWSLYYAQAANLHRLCRQPRLSESHVMSGRGPPLVLSSDGVVAGHYMYVDNAGVLTTSEEVASNSISEAVRDFGQYGLLFHEVDIQKGAVARWGVSWAVHL